MSIGDFAEFHGLDDRNRGVLEQAASVFGLVDAGDDHRLGVLAEQGRDRALLLLGRIAGIEDEDLDAGRAGTHREAPADSPRRRRW